MPDSGPGTDLALILTAAFDEFEVLRVIARRWEGQVADLFPAFLLAGSVAADGRDSLTTAPAFPAGHPFPPPPGQPPTAAGGGIPAADQMAARAAALAVRLDHAASITTTARDRRACRDAAATARQIRELMAGDGACDPR